MNKLTLTALTIGGLGVASAGALAGHDGDHGGKRGKHFEHMDTNGDGVITEDELSERAANLIEKADTDGDGAVSKDEMKAYHEARRKEWREKNNADKNNDGVVDRTEFLEKAQERFDKMDKNGDGVLSEDERRSRRHHRRGR